MWSDNGVTFKRFLLDQAPVVAAWGGSQVRVPFQAIKQAGFLRRLLMQIPRTQYGMTITSTDNLTVTNAENQLPAFRAIASLSLTLQRVAPLYQLTQGIDLAYLMFMGCGRTHSKEKSGLGYIANLTQTNTTSLGKSSAAWDYIAGIVAVSTGSGTAQNVQFGLVADLPLTEWIQFPAGVVTDPQGKSLAVPATAGETGLISLQNSQQNVVPAITLNPFYAASGRNNLYTQATALPSNTVAPLVNLYAELYDVPEDPAEWPPGYSFDYVVQYTSTDDAISGQKVIHKFDNAGYLMRAAYVFMNGDQIVDCSNLATDGQATFKWGSQVIHRDRSFQANLSECLERYGEPPLYGAIYDDFFTDSQSFTDLINTAVITSPRVEITGAPSSATNLHTIEQRLIPVMVRRG